MRLNFRSAGIEVFEQKVEYDSGFFAAAVDAVVPVSGDKSWPHAFVIEVTGNKARIGQMPVACAVYVGTRLQRAEVLRDFTPVGLVTYGQTGTLLTGPPDNSMQQAITEKATEAATSLANAILKAR